MLRPTHRATVEAIGAVDDWDTILQAHKKASVKVVEQSATRHSGLRQSNMAEKSFLELDYELETHLIRNGVCSIALFDYRRV